MLCNDRKSTIGKQSKLVNFCLGFGSVLTIIPAISSTSPRLEKDASSYVKNAWIETGLHLKAAIKKGL